MFDIFEFLCEENTMKKYSYFLAKAHVYLFWQASDSGPLMSFLNNFFGLFSFGIVPMKKISLKRPATFMKKIWFRLFTHFRN